jgi:hypothetical protein
MESDDMAGKSEETSKTQMVRVDAKLWKRLTEEASRAGRTPRQELENRLRQSLAGVTEAPSGDLVPKAIAVGRLAARLANDVIAYSDASKTAAMLKASVSGLLDEMGGAASLGGEDQQQARTFADYLLVKMANAEERSFHEGVPTPLSREQRELLEIRQVLGDWVSAWRSSKRNAGARRASGKEQS